MMSRDSFLRAIEAEPDDDVVRLAFADWLEENGDSDRARFIRLQCEHAQLFPKYGPAQGSSQLRKTLERQIDALLKKHRSAWTAGVPKWAAAEGFERGFLNVYSMTGKQFLDGAAAIRAVAPLSTLFLRLLKGREEEVFASEHLGGVRRLWAEGALLTDAGVASLAASPHVRPVHFLGLGRCILGPEDANKLTDAAALTLASSDNLPELTELDLDGYQKITPAGIRALLESKKRAGLTVLSLNAGSGGPAFATAMHKLKFRLTKLERLCLSERKVGDAGAQALAAVPLGTLQDLWLGQNGISDRGAAALAASRHLQHLTRLDLARNNLTDSAVRALLASPHLENVRELDLSENPWLTDASARAVLDDGRAWQKVELEGTRVSQELLDEMKARCQAR
jgi:uncharacterized protein (TIGR02996 family)